MDHKVLIVDDDQSIINIVSRLITRKTNFAPIPALNGLEALDRIKEINPQKLVGIVLDAHMPGMRGSEFIYSLQELDEFEDYRTASVIATGTGFTDEELDRIKNFYPSDRFTILPKPFQSYQRIDCLNTYRSFLE